MSERSEDPTAGRWQVWADTGGTFTDCLAVSPDGRLLRAKVLSSSALRGRVVASAPTSTPSSLTVELPYRLPDGFCDGFAFRLLASTQEGGSAGGEEGGGQRVVASRALHRPEESGGEGGFALILELAGSPSPVEPGAACELASPEEAPILAARLLTATPAGRPLPPLALRLATTRGTNALLERRGAAVALLVTRGFGDLLVIGDQQRPELFALQIERPAPLYRQAVEVDERLAADGRVLAELDEAAIEREGRRLRDAGIEAAAVAFLHSYRHPDHERRAAAALRRAGLRHVAASAELAPLIKLLPRAQTAVVEAYLGPLVQGYLERVAGALEGRDATAGPGAAAGTGAIAGSVHVMTSAGGLVRAEGFAAKDSLLSGPAGGVVGAAAAGRRSGIDRLIAFDMGGTSTDVARWAGELEYLFEHRVGDARLVAPALAIESVAAGGGSICHAEAGQLKVGPASAGAHPGPACYGAGGPLTLTDVNLLLGRLAPERFEIPVDRAAAEAAWRRLAGELDGPAGDGTGAGEQLLAGLLQIADERMADAIRAISLARGFDPAEHALVAFGGAGGQHACGVAERLGIGTVLVPADAGLLSAVGLGAAVVERFVQRQLLEPLPAVARRLPKLLREMADQVRAAVATEGVPEDEIELRRRILLLRLVGQEAAVEVELPAGLAGGPEERGKMRRQPDAEWLLREGFESAYRRLYGYPPPDRPVEAESLKVVASSRRRREGTGGEPAEATAEGAQGAAPEPVGEARGWFGGSWQPVPLYDRPTLPPGTEIAGPALIVERHSTTVVPPGWGLVVDRAAALVVTRASSPAVG